MVKTVEEIYQEMLSAYGETVSYTHLTLPTIA